MFTLLISLAIAVVVFFVVCGLFSAVAAILPALIALVAAFFLISRKLAKILEPQMMGLQKELNKGQVDNVIVVLQNIKQKYGRWQFLISATIDGQIGSIYYMKGQFQKAKPYLERAFVRHWIAKAMLAVIYYRERKFDKMNEVFEHATRHVKKTGLLWSLWAYCVWQNGDLAKAINILGRGKAALRDADPNLTQNLLSLQNSKKMKMRSYGDQWYQFQLEFSPAQTQLRQGRVRFKNR